MEWVSGQRNGWSSSGEDARRGQYGAEVERVERLREGDQGQKRAEDIEKEAKQEGGHGKEKTTDVCGKRVEN